MVGGSNDVPLAKRFTPNYRIRQRCDKPEGWYQHGSVQALLPFREAGKEPGRVHFPQTPSPRGLTLCKRCPTRECIKSICAKRRSSSAKRPSNILETGQVPPQSPPNTLLQYLSNMPRVASTHRRPRVQTSPCKCSSIECLLHELI